MRELLHSAETQELVVLLKGPPDVGLLTTSGGHETLFDRLKSETQRGSALFQVGRTLSFLICFANQQKIC